MTHYKESFQPSGRTCETRTLDSSLRSASFGMTDAAVLRSEYLMRVVIGTTNHDRGSKGDWARVAFGGMKNCAGAFGRGGGSVKPMKSQISDAF